MIEFPITLTSGGSVCLPGHAFALVPGTTAPTTYTPYIGQTATLTLPRTIYGGEVDAVTGEGQETWKIATIDAKKNQILI